MKFIISLVLFFSAFNGYCQRWTWHDSLEYVYNDVPISAKRQFLSFFSTGKTIPLLKDCHVKFIMGNDSTKYYYYRGEGMPRAGRTDILPYDVNINGKKIIPPPTQYNAWCSAWSIHPILTTSFYYPDYGTICDQYANAPYLFCNLRQALNSKQTNIDYFATYCILADTGRYLGSSKFKYYDFKYYDVPEKFQSYHKEDGTFVEKKAIVEKDYSYFLKIRYVHNLGFVSFTRRWKTIWGWREKETRKLVKINGVPIEEFVKNPPAGYRYFEIDD